MTEFDPTLVKTLMKENKDSTDEFAMVRGEIVQAPPKRKIPELPAKGLNIKIVNLLMPFVENFWHERKQYPSDAVLYQEFGLPVADVLTINSHPMWLAALDRRGIRRPDSIVDLTPTQQAAIALVSNYHDRRSKHDKLLSIGCSVEEYNGWMSDPVFKRTLQSRADDILGNVGIDAQVGLASLIQKEDFRAIKFYMEITGQAASPEAINVKRTMQILIEAVQKHVKDPAVMQAIAAEVQSVRSIEGVQ